MYLQFGSQCTDTFCYELLDRSVVLASSGRVKVQAMLESEDTKLSSLAAGLKVEWSFFYIINADLILYPSHIHPNQLMQQRYPRLRNIPRRQEDSPVKLYIIIIMGNSLNTDKRVRIYLALNHPVTYAGQYLEGTAHLQVLEDTPYRSLNVNLVCNEEVLWSEKKNNVATVFQNKRKTYEDEFVLARFDEGLKAGQYSFPFAVLLPASLPASFNMAAKSYISYTLKVLLPPWGDISEPQVYQSPLNIRQPLRMQSSLSQYGTCTSKSWSCLGTKTSGIFHLQVDRNQIRQNESFKIRGFIDNVEGQFAIEQFTIELARKIVRVSTAGHADTINDDIAVLVKPKVGVKVGLQKKFEAEVKLPQILKEYTAIGNIISRTYYITFIGQVGCCYEDIKIEKHIIVNNDNFPPEEKGTLKAPPQNWNPKIYPSLTYIALKPYLYQPAHQIKTHNQRQNGTIPNSMLYIHMSTQDLVKTGEAI